MSERAVSLSPSNNPFPSFAVARFGSHSADGVTIETEALRSARAHLKSYLEREQVGSDGTTIAVLGDYGMGKTHLARELARQATDSERSLVISLEPPSRFPDGPGRSFMALYQGSFFQQLNRSDVLARIREYYADIVASSLGGEPAMAGIGEQLRSGELDPQFVVDRLGLMESRLLARVEEKLSTVTQNPEFALLLTLMLRPDFEFAAWEWLKGEAPDALLVERGMTRLESDSDALEAMGVLALLFGHRGHRVVIIIDELERLIAESADPQEDILAFRKLLNVCAAAGSMLVLVGLGDFLQQLGKDMFSRIGVKIYMSALDAEDVIRYIRESQGRAFGQKRLYPFDEQTVKYLVDIADGVARRVVLLCHHAYRLAADSATPVTEAMLREVARSHIGIARTADARSTINRILRSEGLDFRRDYYLDAARTLMADYWIHGAQGRNGTAVLISDTVLTEADVDKIGTRFSGVRQQAPNDDVVQVVSGYLAASLGPGLANAIEAEPLLYDRRTFDDDFIASIQAIAVRRREQEQDPVLAIEDRVERLGRQQQYTHSAIEQVNSHLDDLRGAFTRQFALLENEIRAAGSRPEPNALSPGDSEAAVPRAVQLLFDQVGPPVDDLAPVEEVVELLFAESEQASTAASALRQHMRSESTLPSIAIAFILRQLIFSLRSAVDHWATSLQAEQRSPGEQDWERLDAICRAFDSAFYDIPHYRIDALQAWTGALGRGQHASAEQDRNRQKLNSLTAQLRAVFKEAY